MRTAIVLAVAAIALTACGGGGSDRPIVVNQPPANVTVTPAPVVVQPAAPAPSTTIICPAGSAC